MKELFIEEVEGAPIGFLIVLIILSVIAFVFTIMVKDTGEKIYIALCLAVISVVLGALLTLTSLSRDKYYYLQITDDAAYEQLIKDYKIVSQYDNKIYKCIKNDIS